MVRVLFDSHALVWFLAGDRRFSSRARDVIAGADTVPCVSAVTAWEIANKVRLGKWPEATALAAAFSEIVDDNGFQRLPITVEQALVAGFLVAVHRDPFDRMLAAQAQVEGIPLITADPAFQSLGTQVLW
jgi:PIN domain nuclease of toxin-antitoxin system